MNRTFKTALLMSASVSVSAITASQALAQSTQPGTVTTGTAAGVVQPGQPAEGNGTPPVSTAANAVAAGDIVVTANRATTLLSKTPISISAFSGQTLRDNGVVNVSDLRTLAPGLEVGNAGQGPNIAIRGVGTTDFTSKGEQGTSFNIDTIPIGRPQVFGLAFYDLERVEVLRGPQGTLYGKSATGGAVNVITATPKDYLEAAATGEIGNLGDKRAEAMVNLPLGDGFAVRAAGAINRTDGYLHPVLGPRYAGQDPQTLNAEDNWSTRLSGMWRGTDGDVRVTGTFGHVGGTGDINNGALYYRVTANPSARSSRDVYYNPFQGHLDDNYTLINGEANYNIGPIRLTYDGGHLSFRTRDNKSESTGDAFDGQSVGSYNYQLYNSRITEENHEIRLSNSRPGRLTWILGANYFDENIREADGGFQSFVDPTGATYPACTAPNLTPACNVPGPNILGSNLHRSKGVFGQATYTFGKLKITGGLRYSSDNARRTATLAAGGGPFTFTNAQGQPCGPVNGFCVGNSDSGENNTHKVTYRVGLDYQLTPNQLIYGYVATGYKSGSFNDADPRFGGGVGPYGPESVTAYEVGYKGRVVDGLRVTAAGYYYDYKKYQLTGATFLGPGATATGMPLVVIYTTLVPAKFYGGEFELAWNATRADTFNLTATLAHGAYGKGARVGFVFNDQIDWSGHKVDNLPTFALTAAYEHRFLRNDGSYFSVGARTKYSSGYGESDLGGVATGMFGPPFLIPALANPLQAYAVPPTIYHQKSFTRSEATVGWTSANSKLSVQGFVRNIENQMQILGPPLNINAPGTGTRDYTTVRVSSPRTYGVRISVKY